jgi:hypothetical protein
MEGTRPNHGSEFPRRRSSDTTALFHSQEDLELAKTVSTLQPGITVEIFRKETPIDVEVAAQAYMLELELREDTEFAPDHHYREAKFAMRKGGGVARIIVEALPDEEHPVPTRFWRAFHDLKDKPQ